MLTEHILAALVHWLNGDPEMAGNEGFEVESAILSGGRIKVQLLRNDGMRVVAMFALMEVSLPAKIRQKEDDAHGNR